METGGTSELDQKSLSEIEEEKVKLCLLPLKQGCHSLSFRLSLQALAQLYIERMRALMPEVSEFDGLWNAHIQPSLKVKHIMHGTSIVDTHVLLQPLPPPRPVRQATQTEPESSDIMIQTDGEARAVIIDPPPVESPPEVPAAPPATTVDPKSNPAPQRRGSYGPCPLAMALEEEDIARCEAGALASSGLVSSNGHASPPRKARVLNGKSLLNEASVPPSHLNCLARIGGISMQSQHRISIV